ncbi:MAG: glutamine-hydrolyzing carbamoyl-phosphate synthase small subunit [Gemmatimonadota bacterium]|nr:glutamine-hydrolyzing carbamoyl-phosphate synthase small subunit [Gemmatimonadota bacterium]
MPAEPLTQEPDGVLVLEDGTRFSGRLAGSGAEGTGEVVFTTNLAGYQEVLTDPSYAGQIVVMTAPMIGNYGIAGRDDQAARPHVAGFVVRELSGAAYAARAEGDLGEWLRERQIPAMVSVDTRALTRHVRSRGAMRAVIARSDRTAEQVAALLAAEPPMEGRDLATGVSTREPYEFASGAPDGPLVVCLDLGIKRESLRILAAAGLRVLVVPAATPAAEILDSGPAGLFVSNGPGDPAAIPGAPETVRAVAEAGVPVFGICLGCQLLARAFGGDTWKLPYGHRGGNHPVRDLDSGEVEITSQNHGFAIRGEEGEVTGAPALRVTHRNLNDGTVEGVAHKTLRAFGVQYHPEAAPGPHDARHLFERFLAAVTASGRSPNG